jgi:hypothetical protein
MSFDLKITNGDLSLDANGNINLITGNQKIIQEIAKITLTDLGENVFHPYYGCKAGSLNLENIVDYNFQRQEIERSVKSAINNLILLKNNQNLNQELNPSEIILTLDEVVVERDNLDPRMWSVFISVTTLSLDDIKTSVKIRI